MVEAKRSDKPPLADDEFFVGYRPTPVTHARFLRGVVALAMFATIVLSLLLGMQQRDPGDGQWNLDAEREFRGIAVARPYAMLIENSAVGVGGIRTYLLVGENKVGAVNAVAAYDGRAVTLRGTLLERDGRSMISIAQDAVTLDSDASSTSVRLAQPESLGRRTLRGEIIDPKCYIGAMKPGGGKTHKGCAVLCLRGGIPPMLVTQDEAGHETYFLLTDATGGAIVDTLLPFVGEPVELTGELMRQGDVFVLRCDENAIRPF